MTFYWDYEVRLQITNNKVFKGFWVVDLFVVYFQFYILFWVSWFSLSLSNFLLFFFFFQSLGVLCLLCPWICLNCASVIVPLFGEVVFFQIFLLRCMSICWFILKTDEQQPACSRCFLNTGRKTRQRRKSGCWKGLRQRLMGRLLKPRNLLWWNMVSTMWLTSLSRFVICLRSDSWICSITFDGISLQKYFLNRRFVK